MMVEDIKHTTIPKCKFNDSGYCKFGNRCRKRHFIKICTIFKCKTSNCKARHPKLCKHEENCKFFKHGICAYRHETLDKHDDKFKALESEIKILKNENTVLKHKITEVEKSFIEELSSTEKLKSQIKDLENSIKIKTAMIEKLQQEDLEKASLIDILSEKIENNEKMELKNECPKCHKLIIPGQSIEDHILSVHNAKCTKCEKAFVSLPKLEKHMKFDHVLDETKIPCKKCNFVFLSVSDFDKHLSGHEHNQVKKSIIECEESDDDNDDFYDDDEFYIDTCNYCGLIVNLFEELDHHHSNYLRCESCEVCFHNEFQFQKHETCERY